jgi:hypothetical protein
MKIGHYVPGTRIPIESEKVLFRSGSPPKLILNLAWHISEEVSDYLRKNGYKGDVIDILSPQELKK